MMKFITALLASVAASCALAAVPPGGEEIEFRHEPSFSDGTLIWLGRLSDGKIQGAAYSLPLVVENGVASHAKSKPKPLREFTASPEQFAALVRAIEGSELRSEAEAHARAGLDGSDYIFQRKAGVRTLAFRFWNPPPPSTAAKLAAQFLRVAQIDSFDRKR